MFEQSYLYITLIGFTSLSVIYYFHKIFKNLLKLLSKLLQIQPQENQNITDYIDKMQKSLLEMGVKNIFYDIRYSKKRVYKEYTQEREFVTKMIDDSLIKGSITLEVKNNRGENKIINELILYVIMLQVTNAIHAKINTINASFEKISKLQTYMMHDLKNILQFFQAMQYNVENLSSKEEEQRFIEFLQNSTQPINRKVNKILALLQVRTTLQETSSYSLVDVHAIILEYVEYFKLDAKIEGECLFRTNEENLRTVVDNVLGNIHDKMFHDSKIKTFINLSKKEDLFELLISDNGDSFINPQEVLEPFYSTKSEGIGIGMYHASTLIELMGGRIECYNEENKPTVKISLYEEKS